MPAKCAPVSFSAGTSSGRVACTAGARPKISPHNNDSARVTSSTVQFTPGLQHQPVVSIGQQCGEQAGAGDREEDAGGAAHDREHEAFGQQLANQPEPARADAQANGDLTLPRCRSREQEIGRVRARDREDQADDRLEEVERLLVSPAQRVETTAAVADRQHRQIGAFRVIPGGGGDPLRKRRAESGVGLLPA